MNTIIPVHTANGIQTCDARELHAFLEVGKDFSNWIKDRIAAYGFVDGIDFHVEENLDSPNLANQKRHGGDRRSKDYLISLDMAKELSMVERNAKGREARRYFIECERLLRAEAEKPRVEENPRSGGIPRNISGALRLAADLYDENEDLRARLEKAEGRKAADQTEMEALAAMARRNGRAGVRDVVPAMPVSPASDDPRLEYFTECLRMFPPGLAGVEKYLLVLPGVLSEGGRIHILTRYAIGKSGTLLALIARRELYGAYTSAHRLQGRKPPVTYRDILTALRRLPCWIAPANVTRTHRFRIPHESFLTREWWVLDFSKLEGHLRELFQTILQRETASPSH